MEYRLSDKSKPDLIVLDILGSDGEKFVVNVYEPGPFPGRNDKLAITVQQVDSRDVVIEAGGWYF